GGRKGKEANGKGQRGRKGAGEVGAQWIVGGADARKCPPGEKERIWPALPRLDESRRRARRHLQSLEHAIASHEQEGQVRQHVPSVGHHAQGPAVREAMVGGTLRNARSEADPHRGGGGEGEEDRELSTPAHRLYPQGVLKPRRGPARRTRASELQVGEERTLAGRGRRPATTRLRVLLARGLLGPFTLGSRPTLLVRDLVTLLDHEQIYEARQRMCQKLEIALPVAGRLGQRLHLVRGQRQRRSIALPRGQLELLEDPRAADARGTRHATPSSRRTMRAASTMERNLATPTQRGVSQSPQSGTSQSRSAGICFRAR